MFFYANVAEGNFVVVQELFNLVWLNEFKHTTKTLVQCKTTLLRGQSIKAAFKFDNFLNAGDDVSIHVLSRAVRYCLLDQQHTFFKFLPRVNVSEKVQNQIKSY